MTAIVAMESYKLDDTATVSLAATLLPDAKSGLLRGETITIENLIKCLLIPSGNDAACAC